MTARPRQKDDDGPEADPQARADQPEARRSAAPDIVACILLLFAASMVFAVLRAFYETNQIAVALRGALAWTALLSICGAVARGVLLRQPWSLGAALCLLGIGAVAAIAGFHIPDTVELPTAMLSLLGGGLLLVSHREFRSAST